MNDDLTRHTQDAISAIRNPPPLHLVHPPTALSDPRANARRGAVELGRAPNEAGTQRLAEALGTSMAEGFVRHVCNVDPATEMDAQSRRTLQATRVRVPPEYLRGSPPDLENPAVL